MSLLQAEVYEAFRALDVPDDKALKAAVALSAALSNVEDGTTQSFAKRDADVQASFSKRDADIEATRKDISAIKTDINGINLRLAVMTGEMNLLKWMMGTTIALVVTVLFRVFTH